MKTRVINLNDSSANPEDIIFAAELIKSGQLVAFPTETVYGLGADAMNPVAIEKIFKVKNRPTDNPMIVHIYHTDQLKQVVAKVPKTAHQFIKEFWPGPLSIVFSKNINLPESTTAGLDSVVVRFPKHPVAQALIEAVGSPISAPSANLSGKVSPTRAEHVLEDLNGKIPLILDAGEIEFGLESTVVDCTSKIPVVLRPGSITLEMLKKVVPATVSATTKESPKSPGMKYRHYAPDVPITLFTGNHIATAKAILEYISKHDKDSVVVMWHTGNFSQLPNNYRLPVNNYEAAPLLFHTLRTADIPTAKRILIQGYDSDGIGVAIMNRLEKAAEEIIRV
ncbi:threonylcarbamoyl-AMP synthase [Candidatus Kaiserbacteria bacterium]|nr:threonylcarbamoyl-AMP synthase [Candidatus Kaiserbacteria bacterium]